MRFALTQKILTFALAGVAAFPLLVSGEIGAGWALSLPILGVIGWMLEPPLTRDRRFRRAITIVVIAVFAVQVARFATGEQMAMMGMEFAVALLGIKLCSRGAASDYSQIVILSFMQIIAATVAINEISYGFSFLAFVALCPPVIALSYLRREMEHRFGEGHHQEGPEMLERLLRSKRVVSSGFVIGSSLLSVPILLVTALLFITFPRIGLGLFGMAPKNQATIGFSNEVTLGDIDLIRSDSTVLMRMEPFGFKSGLPSHLPIKIRGAVFDVYEGNRWKRSRDSGWKQLKRKGNDFPLDDKFLILENTPGFNVLLESLEPPLILVPDGTGVIKTYTVATGGRPQPRTLEENGFGAIRYKDDANVGIRYRVYISGAPPYGGKPDNRRDYMQIPKGSERLVELARRYAGSGAPEEQARRIIANLGADYRYSLELSGSKANALAKTPLERFLFTRKTGTCEHFATAFTLMLRAVGIPSRLVTGISGADWNPIGNYYAARSMSAHSWTEAFLNGRWRTMDATPPGQDTGLQNWYPTAVSMFLDAMRMRWHKHVVGYDASTQFEVAMGLWKFWKKVSAPGQADVRVAPWPVWAVVFGLAAAGIAFWLRKNMPRLTLSPRESKKRRRYREATKLYRDLERRLARLGYPRPLSRTPEEHAETVAAQAVTIAQPVRQLTLRYNEIRFGRGRFGQGEVEKLRLRIKSLNLNDQKE